MKRNRFLGLVTALLVGLLLLAGCQTPPSSDAQVVSLFRQVQEFLSQLNELDTQVQSNSGQMENLARRLAVAESHVSRLRTDLDSTFSLLQNMYASVTYLDWMGAPPTLVEQPDVPSMQEIEKLVSQQVLRLLSETPISTASAATETQPERSELAAMQREIDILRRNYLVLRWQMYRDLPSPTDPFSLEDLSLVTGGTVSYRVQSGDTVSAIVTGMGLPLSSVDQVLENNGISDPRGLRSGQVLQLPLPPLVERIVLPVKGFRTLSPEHIHSFFGDSTELGISRGLSFSLSDEQLIVSVLPGKVIDVADGYVVIYHGNDLKLVYTLLDSSWVERGDWVGTGQAIGVCKGKQFRLEMLVGAEYRDPMWLFLQNLGSFELTFYTEWDDGNLPFFPYFRRAKSGDFAREWYTVAADPALLSPGTMLYIPSLKSSPARGLFVVEDEGSAIRGNHLDIYVRDLRLALSSRLQANVYSF
ncbi:MAG TPA: 3D domain-containing protein [Thermotogota bacterium]|nr:3D domain-containing protein [Thermotogota bacterium]